MSRRRKILWGYAALWTASSLARLLAPAPRSPNGMRIAELPAVDHDRRVAGSIRLAYFDTAPRSSGIPIILIHGSPGSSAVFRDFTPLLPPHFRLIVPDLPGFGASTQNLPDYSFRAHAHYLLELLDVLGVRQAHVAGFSMGGGVALSMADLAPERVASIEMISAIGVQEQELLGSYTANHVLHGAQLGALWLLRESFPHFGFLDHTFFNVAYARNFFD